MTILDTFSILFKSNASDVKKDMGDAEKSTAQFQEKINQADKVTGSLATSLLEIATTGVAAFATFQGLKDGIGNSIDMNAQLERQHILSGENVKDLAAWDEALAAGGGTRGDFLSWFDNYSKLLASQGNAQGIQYITKNLEKQADVLKGMIDSGNPEQALNYFRQLQQQNGLPDSFYFSMIKGSEGLERLIEKQKEHDKITHESTEAALEFGKQWEQTLTRVQGGWTSLIGTLLPFINPILKFLNTDVKQTSLSQSLDNWNSKYQENKEAPKNLWDRFIASYNKKPATTEPTAAPPSAPIDTSNGIPISGPAPIDTSNGIPISGPAPIDTSNGIPISGPAPSDHMDAINQLAQHANIHIKSMDSSPYNNGVGNDITSNNPNFYFGNMTINTKATDAESLAKTFHEELNKAIRPVISQHDDGVAK